MEEKITSVAVSGNVEYAEQRISHRIAPVPLIPRSLCVGPRAYMLFFFFGAAAVATGHHLFYKHLDGRAVGPGTGIPDSDGGLDFTAQSVVNGTSNILTKTFVLCAFAVTYTSFRQLLWLKLRQEATAARNLHSILGFQTSFVNIPTWSVLRRMTLLVLVAFCATAIDFLTVFVPGSLITVDESFIYPCSVPVPNLSQAQFVQLSSSSSASSDISNSQAFQPSQSALSLAATIALTGASLAPAGGGTYWTLYQAPLVQCADVTSSTNLTNIFAPLSSAQGVLVWYGAMDQGQEQASLILAGRLEPFQSDPSTLPADQHQIVAFHCTLWNATYSVSVTSGSATAIVEEVNVQQQITTLADVLGSDDTAGQQMYALWLAFVAQLSGNVTYIAASNTLNSTNPFLALNSIAHSGAASSDQSHQTAWAWDGKSPESLMMYMSLSLLSSSFNNTGGYLSSQENSCTAGQLKYSYYNVLALWTAYGLALGIAAACIVGGFIACGRNGRSEATNDSRTASLYAESGSDGPEVTLQSVRVKAVGDGRLSVLS